MLFKLSFRQHGILAPTRKHLRAWLSVTALVICGVLPGIPQTSLASSLAAPVWLCKPGMPNNLCHQDINGNRISETANPTSTYPVLNTTVPLDATRVETNGNTQHEALTVTSNPNVDCFYVYPTVDMLANPLLQLGSAPPTARDAEMATTLSQVGRLQGICRMFVPLYRQVPVPNLIVQNLINGLETYSGPGFGDIQQAFLAYWNNDNIDSVSGKHRPFILLGHSQGANALQAMMKLYLDGPSAENVERRNYMVSAVILGGLLQVPFGNPYGNDANSTFSAIPLCQRSSANAPYPSGCVIAYASYRTPPTRSLPNLAANLKPGLQNACVSPSALLQGANADTDTYFDTYSGTRKLFNGTALTPNGSLTLLLAVQGSVITPNYPTGFAHYNGPGWLSGRCMQTGDATQNETWLQINNASSLYSASTLGNLEQALGVGANLGLHVVDYNIDEGSLYSLLPLQRQAWQPPQP